MSDITLRDECFESKQWGVSIFTKGHTDPELKIPHFEGVCMFYDGAVIQ